MTTAAITVAAQNHRRHGHAGFHSEEIAAAEAEKRLRQPGDRRTEGQDQTKAAVQKGGRQGDDERVDTRQIDHRAVDGAQRRTEQQPHHHGPGHRHPAAHQHRHHDGAERKNGAHRQVDGAGADDKGHAHRQDQAVGGRFQNIHQVLQAEKMVGPQADKRRQTQAEAHQDPKGGMAGILFFHPATSRFSCARISACSCSGEELFVITSATSFPLRIT